MSSSSSSKSSETLESVNKPWIDLNVMPELSEEEEEISEQKNEPSPNSISGEILANESRVEVRPDEEIVPKNSNEGTDEALSQSIELPNQTNAEVELRRIVSHPTRQRSKARSTENVPPGTVIDNKICHPKNNDFYWCAHAGMNVRPVEKTAPRNSNEGTDEAVLQSVELPNQTIAQVRPDEEIVPKNLNEGTDEALPQSIELPNRTIAEVELRRIVSHPTRRRSKLRSAENVPQGTAIDNKICYPYLCAHAGMNVRPEEKTAPRNINEGSNDALPQSTELLDQTIAQVGVRQIFLHPTKRRSKVRQPKVCRSRVLIAETVVTKFYNALSVFEIKDLDKALEAVGALMVLKYLDGWEIETRPRTNNPNHKDKFYCHKRSTKQFRSFVEVNKFIKTNTGVRNED